MDHSTTLPPKEVIERFIHHDLVSAIENTESIPGLKVERMPQFPVNSYAGTTLVMRQGDRLYNVTVQAQ